MIGKKNSHSLNALTYGEKTTKAIPLSGRQLNREKVPESEFTLDKPFG